MERLDHFPLRNKCQNWAKLLDGSIWRVTQGVDFDSTMKTFRSNAYRQARARGLLMRTALEGETLILQAFGKEE
jgi:hypothetical protein